MATPTFYVPPPTAEDIARGIQEEVRRQQEATPEPVFQKQNAVQSYNCLCEIEHKRFTSEEVDKFRRGITDPCYWECEARHLKDKLSKTIWQKLLHDYVDGEPSADAWRNVTMAYTRRLMRQRSSKQQVRESRLSIKDQSYWKPEAELLREIAALREHEMQEKHRERMVNSQRIPSPGESETQQEYRRKPRPRRQTPTMRLTRRRRTAKVSDTGRSGVRSSAPKVGKRSGKGRR